jgi:predicted DsbA family dithiol-disulfide isomerase
MLRRKYGVDPAVMFARVEAAARDSGIPLDLSRQPRSYPTERGHTLLRHAGERGTQRALARALFHANFIDARNIADLDTLADVAAAHGFTAAEVRTLLTDETELALTRTEVGQAHRLGIRAVPFFVFADRLAVSGAQPESALRDALAQAS